MNNIASWARFNNDLQNGPKKVSHFHESSLNRIKTRH